MISTLSKLSFLVFLCISYSATSQKNCTVNELAKQHYINTNVEELENIKHKSELNNIEVTQFIENKKSRSLKKSADCVESEYIIPVVFHILHQNGPENVSSFSVKEQVRRLNLDFSGSNSDTSEVVPAFKSVIGNSGIEFRLAKTDPDGNATNGIIRYETAQGEEEPSFNNPWTTGKQWPRDKYMNIYIGKNVGEGVAGFTQYPVWVDNFPQGDAIFMRHTYVDFYDRVLTHEVGHWLNLPHCWGNTNEPGIDDNCNEDDNVLDTPNTIGWQTCNLAGESCGSLDNIQNYMEYTFCNVMFTQGQGDRMQAALNSSLAQRNNLWQDDNLIATGVKELSLVDFEADRKILCAGESATITDYSEYGVCSWIWNAEGSDQENSLSASPEFTYNETGFFDITLEASSSTNTLSLTKEDFILVADPEINSLPYFEGFETVGAIPNSKWQSDIVENSQWQTTVLSGFTGQKSVYFNNFNQSEEIVIELISAPIDLEPLQSAKISFKTAYAQKTSSDKDRLRLLISEDCGKNWIIRSTKLGAVLASSNPQPNSPFIPSNETQWKQNEVTIPSVYISDKFMYKFEFIGKGGNNIYIDDINIFGVYQEEPILNSPSNTAQDIPINVILDWKSVDSTNKYELWIDTSETFNSNAFFTTQLTFIEQNSLNEDTEFQMQDLPALTKHYWKVRTINNQDTSDWSETWSFTTNSGSTSSILKNNIATALSIYPNPTEETLNITLDKAQPTLLQIFDAGGKLVLSQQTNNKVNIISVSGLDKGLYYIQALNNGQVKQSTKFIKN